LLLTLLLTATPACVSQAQEEPPSGSKCTVAIDRASSFYVEGNISEAERLALKLLTENGRLEVGDKFRLNRLLAFCAIANDDEEAGKRYFMEALKYNPAMTPDPITWSPKIRRVYEEARSNYQKLQSESRMKRYAAEAELCRRASLKSLYLPGAGQYAKGYKLRGTVLGVLFAGAVGASLYTQLKLPDAELRYHDASTREDADARWRDYRDAQYRANIVAAFAFSIYCYSFFDALWSPPVEREGK